MLTVDQVASLVSWPAGALAVAYAALVWARWHGRLESLRDALVATLASVAAIGFLLRPLADLGVLGEPERDVFALVLRVAFLILFGGLVWDLIDGWRERRHHKGVAPDDGHPHP